MGTSGRAGPAKAVLRADERRLLNEFRKLSSKDRQLVIEKAEAMKDGGGKSSIQEY